MFHAHARVWGPISFASAAGDMDGDTFLVIWDRAIVDAVKQVEAARYDPARERQAGQITMEHMAR